MKSTTAGNSIWDLIQFDDPNKPNYVSENDFVALGSLDESSVWVDLR